MRIEIPNAEIIDVHEVRDDEHMPLGVRPYAVTRHVVLTVRCYPDDNGEMYSVSGLA